MFVCYVCVLDSLAKHLTLKQKQTKEKSKRLISSSNKNSNNNNNNRKNDYVRHSRGRKRTRDDDLERGDECEDAPKKKKQKRGVISSMKNRLGKKAKERIRQRNAEPKQQPT